MLVTSLEPRDCPVSLVAAAGSLVAGLDPFPGYGGPVEFAVAGDVIVVTANKPAHVKVFIGGVETASFYAYDPAFRGGVNLATDGERIATGTDRGAPHVREFTLHGVELQSYFAGSPESLHGVRVSYSVEQVDPPVLVHSEAPIQIYLDGASAAVTQGVAGIFAAFNVGVTNVYPAQADPRRIATVIIGGAATGTERGFAIIGGFFQQSEFTSYPARVFSESLTESRQIRAAAHEAAHLFGAVHVPDPSSIMFGGIEGGLTFDPLNARVLSQRIGRA